MWKERDTAVRKRDKMSQEKEIRYRSSESDPRTHLVLSKVNQNVYNRRNPCYSKKLRPINKSVKEILLKSLRVLTQISTQNNIFSHKLETKVKFGMHI